MTDLERHEKNRSILEAHKEIVALKELLVEAEDKYTKVINARGWAAMSDITFLAKLREVAK